MTEEKVRETNKIDRVKLNDATDRETDRHSQNMITPTNLIGISPSFVQKDEIRDFVGDAGFNQLLDFVATTIESLGIGEKQLNFFSKLFETGRRVSRSRHHNLWIRNSSPPILVILVRRQSFATLIWEKRNGSFWCPGR